jgi:DNA-sulfur modification-associated
MLLIPSNSGKSKFNKPLYGFNGKYTLSENISLPYFLSLMEVNRAIDELKIAEQIPAELDTQWSIKELFQRSIDEERVINDIVRGYLLDTRKIKFFNAITIILMPKGDDGKVKEKFEDIDSISYPKIPVDGSESPDDFVWDNPEVKTVTFGGVQFSSCGGSTRLRWDEERVLAVAVDGQHRLWALRTFREDPKFRGGTLHTTEQKTKIPVIFVLLDPKVGFQNSQNQSSHSIRGIARELFTDLNKNAKTVDKARALILDDQSINAKCVRTLVTEKTSQDNPNLLPLSLIRWQDDSHKFDTSYYLNSLVHLDLLVSSILELKLPNDPTKSKDVNDFIGSINKSLGINGKEVSINNGERTLSRCYREDYCDEDGEPESPFIRLPDDYLDSVVDGFRINFHPWLLKILLEFKPYKELLDYARKHNLIEGDFGKYQAQTKKHKSTIKDEKIGKNAEWYDQEISIHQDKIFKGKENQWAFKAIFQKAIIRLGKLVEFQYKGRDPNLGNINDVLKFLDRLYDQGILKVDAKLSDDPYYLWSFMALTTTNQKIKATKSVEDTIFAMLKLWYFASRKIEIDRLSSIEWTSKRKLLKFFSADTQTAHWAGCNEAYGTIRKSFSVVALYGKDHENLSDDKKKEMVRERFSTVLWAGLPLSSIQKIDIDEEIDN